MKGFRVFVVLGWSLLLHTFAYAQNDIIADLKETIKTGSGKELSRFLYQTVDVDIEGSKQSYSKAQAEFVFRDFFKQHPPSEVTIIHQGASKGGQLYAIFQYKSGSEIYRVFLKVKSNERQQQLLHEISFLKE